MVRAFIKQNSRHVFVRSQSPANIYFILSWILQMAFSLLFIAVCGTFMFYQTIPGGHVALEMVSARTSVDTDFTALNRSIIMNKANFTFDSSLVLAGKQFANFTIQTKLWVPFFGFTTDILQYSVDLTKGDVLLSLTGGQHFPLSCSNISLNRSACSILIRNLTFTANANSIRTVVFDVIPGEVFINEFSIFIAIVTLVFGAFLIFTAMKSFNARCQMIFVQKDPSARYLD